MVWCRNNLWRNVGALILVMAVTALLLPSAKTVSAASVVSEDGWEWQNPLPQGNTLYGVWGSSSTDVFAVGWSGTILHYNGSDWSPMDSGTTSILNGVWGSSSTDVFAVGGEGTILHYDGSAWSQMTSGTTEWLQGVWGTSSNNVFAVGGEGSFPGVEGTGTILHYDGSSWSPMTIGTTEGLLGVWGSSSTDVFAVGDTGTILHYDGAAWSAMTSGTTELLTDVWGSSDSDVFAVDDTGGIRRYDGSTWSYLYSTVPNNAVWGTSSTDVFAVGGYGGYFDGFIWHYSSSHDGYWWYEMDYAGTQQIETLHGVWGSSSTDVFAVGNAGTILHYDGSIWNRMSSGPTNSLHDIWGSSSSDVFAAGMYGILHYDGSAWNKISSTSAECIWGSSETDVFAGTQHGIIQHYDGSAWSQMESGTTEWIESIWGTSSSDVFAVGHSGTILHYDGSSWNAMSSGVTWGLQDVWGSSSSDVYAVMGGTMILHYDGTSWQSSSVAFWNLNAVWGTSSSDIFAVGYKGSNGVILHYDGSAWSQMDIDVLGRLTDVWGSSSSDVYAVGYSGTILHYDGSGWSEMESGSAVLPLTGIWGSSASDIFAAGYFGTVLHYGGLAPAIAAVSPDSGHQGETLNVTITGTEFTGTEVSFGAGITVNSFTVDSATQITASITIAADAAVGTRDVLVTTSGGTGILEDGFSVLVPSDTWAVIVSGDATYSTEDATELYDRLSPLWGEDHIKLLVGSDATKAGIEDAITNWLAPLEDADDTVLFFFSGHGNEKAVLVYDSTEWLDTQVQGSELDGWLSGLDSEHMVICLESCRSGALIDDLEKNNRVILTSCASKEDAWAWSNLEHSVFCYYLLESLDELTSVDENGDLKISAEEIFDYIEPKVISFTEDHTVQHPQISDGYSGQLGLFTLVPITIESTAPVTSITVDGVDYSPEQFPYTVTLVSGTNCTVSIPEEISGEAGVRYVFNSWSDGDTSSSREVTASAPATLTAGYTTQYYLSIESYYSDPQGAGWYDEGAYASFSAGQGEEGWSFTGWSGDSSTSSATGSIVMNSPKSIRANWEKEEGSTDSGESDNEQGDEEEKSGGFLDCVCGSKETMVSGTELMTGWGIIGMLWGGGYYLVRRRAKPR